MGTTCTGGYKGVQAVRSGSVAAGGCFKVVWNLECPVGLSQIEICAHFDEGNLGSLPKKIIVELCGGFEFSRPKVAPIEPNRC